MMNQSPPQLPSGRFKQLFSRRRNQIALAAIAALAVSALIGALLVRNVVRRGWPQTEGVLSLVGLRAPVTVVRDHYGVPHIFAENEDDLFFAQGYVHAQDRFWGMELQRRRGRGTLAELLGDDAASGDAQWAALNLPDLARRELAAMDAATRAPLDAYAAGVNAWLAQHRGQLPLEYQLLDWRGREAADPARWTAEDALIVSLALGLQVGGPQVDPSLATQIMQQVGPERGAFLLSSEPEHTGALSPDSPLHTLNAAPHPVPRRWPLGNQVTLVSADQTASGKALMAVDLPTGLALPTPWYVMAWRVGDDGAAGASVPGFPGLVVGADDRAAWAAWSSSPQYALLSLLQELAPNHATPPWGRWLLAALLNAGQMTQPDGEQAPRTNGELQARQRDTHSARAERLIPLLVEVEPEGWRQERVTGMLRRWDCRIGENNKEAPFFAVYQAELARAAFADELGADLFEAYVAQSDLYQAALDRILDDPGDAWWDDVNTPQREGRGDMLKRAYEPALEWIGRNYGDLHMLWEWDVVHGSRLHHPLGDAWPWDQLLSRDLYPDGWADTINASPGGLPCTGGICMGGDLFRAKAVYGYRQIVDANDPTTLWFTLLPGQSGHPFSPHYADLMDEWLAGEYQPLRLAASPGEVAGAVSMLTLKPGD